MSIAQPYPAPPIVDAVVELRFKGQFSKREQERFVSAVKSGYDRHDESGEVDVQVRITNGQVEAQTGAAKPVHSFTNNDQNDMLRIDETKLHWSRLPPYEGWPSFQARIFRDLGRLNKKISLTNLERIGVRYRNRIDVPIGNDNVGWYEDYLSINLHLPDLLDPHDGYQWRIDKHFGDRLFSTTIQSGAVQPELPNTVAILLDIDVFAIEDMPNSLDQLSEKLDRMRLLKNEIFESCITDKARASFQ